MRGPGASCVFAGGPPRTLSWPLPAPLSREFTAACHSCPHHCYSDYSKKVSLPCGTQRNCTSRPSCPNSTIPHVKIDDRPHREQGLGGPAGGALRLCARRQEFDHRTGPAPTRPAGGSLWLRAANRHPPAPQSLCLQSTSRNQHVMTVALFSSGCTALGLGVVGQVLGCASRTRRLPRAHESVHSSRRCGGRGRGLRDRGFLCGRGKGGALPGAGVRCGCSRAQGGVARSGPPSRGWAGPFRSCGS